jgi:hypothetical protein
MIQLPNIGNWKKRHFCVECKHVMDKYDRFENDGVCPYCGHAACTSVCSTNEIIYAPILQQPKEMTRWEYFCSFFDPIFLPKKVGEITKQEWDAIVLHNLQQEVEQLQAQAEPTPPKEKREE